MSIERTEHANYMPSLDGLRGFACMLVVFSHINHILEGLITSGNFVLGSSGVLIFFSLSGFLMGSLYFQKSFDFTTASKYIVSRFSRITPAYYIAIAFTLLMSLFIADFQYDMDATMIARSFAFMGSAGVFWSIPPEVQFYAFFILIWGAYHRAKSGQYALCVLVFLLSIIFIGTRDLWGGILLPSKFHIFLFGFAGSILLLKENIRKLIGLLWVQMLLILGTLFYIGFFVSKQTLYYDLIVAVLVALCVASLSQSSLVTKFFELKFMRVLGAASFSIYLFHDAFLRATYELFDVNGPIWFQVILCLAISLIPTIAFHYFAEKPMNERAKKWGYATIPLIQSPFQRKRPTV